MREKGFTLIEAVMIVVLMLILAMAAYPRFEAVSSARVGAAGRVIVADIRYAQSQAISTRLNHRVVFNSSGYQVQQNNGGWQVIDDLTRSGANDYIVQLTDDYAGVVVDGTPPTVQFDYLGAPVPDADLSLTISNSGSSPSRQITVKQHTGRVVMN